MARAPMVPGFPLIWLGGVFYWVLRGFKGSLSDQLREKFDSRNLWTGYLLGMMVLLFYVYLLVTNNR